MTATLISFDMTELASASTGATALVNSSLNPATDPIWSTDRFVSYQAGNTGYIVRIHLPP